MNQGLVVLVRGIIAFVTLLIFARALGRQQISQLTFFEYVLGITIGSTASTLTTDLTTRAWSQWLGLLIWVIAVLIVQVMTLKSRTLSKYIDGEPVIVIMNGKIMENAMKTMRYRVSDLLEQLRNNGDFDITQIEFAVLETSGKLSVLKKSQHRPLTPHDMNISTNYSGLSTELIYDGIIIDQNLTQFGLNRRWLREQLKNMGIHDISQVFYAALDTQGTLYVDQYRDHIQTPVDISDNPGPN